MYGSRNRAASTRSLMRGSLIQKLAPVGLLATALVLTLMAGVAFGQTAGTGTITGVITDPKGLPMVDVSVTLHNVDTGIDHTLTTNDSGIYVGKFLQPGLYEITSRKEAFATMVRKDLRLEVGQTLTIDLQMPLQTQQGEITVTAASPVLETDKTEQSEVVTQNLTSNLPIAGRRWDSFVLLTPNVTTDGPGGLVSYRGVSGLYNSNNVDGANNNNAFWSEARGRTSITYGYSMDSIKEFQVTAANYSAEFGQAAGGVVNAVTKNGTNQLHGDLFYYLRYPTLNALDSFSKAQAIANHVPPTQPVHQQQQFGASAGGPIIKDKLFLFGTYDGARKVFPITIGTNASLPLPCTTIVPVGETVADMAAKCAKANSFMQGLLGPQPRNANQDLYFGKLDYQLNSANHLSASYNFNNWTSLNGGYPPPTTSLDTTNSIQHYGTGVVHTRSLVGIWDFTLSSTRINQVRFQWSRDLEVAGANAPGPSVSIPSVTVYGMANALPRAGFPDEHRLQFTDVFSFIKGPHTFKLGFDANLIHDVPVNLFQGGGVYSFSSAIVAPGCPSGASAATGATAFCDWEADTYGFALGDGLNSRHFLSFNQAADTLNPSRPGLDDFWNNNYDGFVEDTWKARPNLTFNLGVRYDIQTIPQPPRPNTTTPLNTLYTSRINIDKNNFAPRVGVAWNFSHGTVVRAGYGIFYALTQNSTFYTIRVENNIVQVTDNCSVASCPSLAFPNVIFSPPGPAVAAPFAGARTPQVTTFPAPAGTPLSRGLTPDFVNPLVHEADLAIEHQLPGDMSVSVSYVMSRGQRLPVFVDSNLAPSTRTITYDVTNTAGVTQNQVTVPLYASSPGVTGRVDNFGVVLLGESVLNSWYHSMVVTFRKPMTHGVELLANYTLSKSIDDGAVSGLFGTFNGTDFIQDPRNIRNEYSLSDLDQRHHFTGSVVWAPPYARNLSNHAERYLLDGWSLSSIVTVFSGQPVNPVFSGSFQPKETIGGVTYTGVDFDATGGMVSNSGGSPGFGTGRVPQLGRNTFTGPGLWNIDLRISRTFPIHERYQFQILGEAFNLFNHPNPVAGSTGYGVNNLFSNYVANGSGVCTAANGHSVDPCITPFVSATQPFMGVANTSNNVYGARQLQISARFSF